MATPAAVNLRRLPGVRRGFLAKATTWVADDHIVAISTGWIHERYHRFYFRDIQAVVITRRPRFIVTWPMAALILLLPGLAFDQTRWATAALLTVAAIAWLAVSWDQSCSCRVYTATTVADLRSIYRVWTARRFLQEVEPLIAGAQGGLPEDAATAILGEIPVPAHATIRRPRQLRDGGAGVGLPAGERGAQQELTPRHAASFSLIAVLFVEALFDAATLIWPDANLEYYGLAILLAEMGIAAWVIFEHHQGRVNRRMQWVAIALLLIIGTSSYIALTSVVVMPADRPAARSVLVIWRQISVVLASGLGALALWFALFPEMPEEG